MVTEIILVPRDPQATESAKQCAQYIARALASIGMKVREQISLCAGIAELQKAVSASLGRSNVVAILGGLEKDQGYLSKTVLSQGLRLPLEQDQRCLDAIKAYCRRTGEHFSLEDAALAQAPQGAVLFPGQYGKTPGYAISSAKQHILLLPDNQTELAAMFAKYLSPYLSGSQAETTVTRTVRTYGVAADQARLRIGSLMDTANPAVTVDRDGGEVLIRVSAHASTTQTAAAMCTPVLRAIAERMGDAAYGLDVDSLQSAVVGKLTSKQMDIAVAEAGTGGILTRVLAETTGGAEVLRYSVAVDDDDAKRERLKLSQKLLRKKGGVSEETAVAMADAARKRASTTLGVAITLGGVKERGAAGKIVYIAVADANNVYVKKLVVDPEGSADVAVDAALSRALNMVRLFVDYLPRPYPSAIPLDEALAGKTVTDKEIHGTQDGPGRGEDADHKGFLNRLLGNFIIRKADETSVKVRKFIFILAMLIFLGSAGYVGLYYYESWSFARQTESLKDMFSMEGLEDVEISEDFPRHDYLPQFAALWTLNPDVAGYLSIDDTGVQYPVVQRTDDTSNATAYYLRRDFYGKSNQHGIPFLDYRADIEEPGDNMIVYGHNMKDGTIFGELLNYQELSYYREHPVIDFSTLYEHNRYKIISVFITNAYENQGPVFAYHDFVEAKSGEDLLNYVNQVRVRSLIETPVDVESTDKLITISTCSYEFKDARFVVVARRVRNGEDDQVNVDAARKNPAPLMPDIWYQLYGGVKPNVNAASVVTNPTTNTSPSGSAQQLAPSPSSSQATSQEAQSQQPQTSASESSRPSSSSAEPGLELPSSSSGSSRQEDAISLPETSAPTADGQDTSRSPDDLVFDLAAFSGFSVSPTLQRDSGITLPASAKTSALRLMATGDDLDFNVLLDDADDTVSTTARDAARLTVKSGGKTITADAADILCRLVQQELGSGFHEEAMKAQAVAAYTYIRHYNLLEQTPVVVLSGESAVSNRVRQAVNAVLGQAVYYNGRNAFTPYHATSAGQTTSSGAVWGGSYPYLVTVDSAVDKKTTHYKVARTFTSDKVAQLLSDKLGIEAWGAPADWFEVLDYADGEYVGRMSICGEITSPKSGARLTGRILRENVLGLRSACFEYDYDADKDTFTFVTYGYGHGVGMSQNGANLYARKGWDYVQILEHYYPGTEVK